jgi:C_GCAxxG_C_C family probable redox protein
MNKPEKAIDIFKRTNCAQAVIAAYAEDYGVNDKTALKFALAFGGGMGRTGETCGAVTGAFMVLGLKYEIMNISGTEKKELAYQKVKEFVKEFKARNNSILCKDLLGLDIGSEEGQKIFNEKDLHHNFCPKFVKDAAEILEKIL